MSIIDHAYPKSMEERQSLHLETFKTIKELGCSPTPLAYAVIYEIHYKKDPALFAQLAEGKKNNDLEACFVDIYTKCFSGSGQKSDDSLAALTAITLDLSTASESAFSSFDGLSNDLKLQIEKLGSSLSVDEIKASAMMLNDVAVDMITSSDQLRSALKSAINQIKTLSHKVEHLQEEVYKDKLTTAYSRIAFDEKLQSILRVNASSFSMIMIDVDHFKSINDAHGHYIGDAVLRYVAKRLLADTPEGCMLARWGGEEFACLVMSNNREYVTEIAEQMRASIAKKSLTIKGTKSEIGKVTASFGITSFVSGDTLESFKERSDQALYESKRTGRNKVTYIGG